MNDAPQLYDVASCLVNGKNGLRQLFFALEYDYADASLPLPETPSLLSALNSPPVLVATACRKDFKVLWLPLTDLNKGTEADLHRYYSRTYPYSLAVFSSPLYDMWHFHVCPDNPESDVNYTLEIMPLALTPGMLRRLSSFALNEETVLDVFALQEQISDACTTHIRRDNTKQKDQRASQNWHTVTDWWGDIMATYPLLSAEEEFRLLSLACKGDKTAKDRLIMSNLRLVRQIASRYTRPEIPLSDLLQEGHIGLMRAVERFDISLGHRFSTYATWWIRRNVERYITEKGRLIRLPVHIHEKLIKVVQESNTIERYTGKQPTQEQLAERTGKELHKVSKLLSLQHDAISLETLNAAVEKEARPAYGEVELGTEAGILANLSTLEFMRTLSRYLTEREYHVLSLRFGLMENKEHTLEEIGHKLEVTRERIRQIEKAALGKITHSSHIMLMLWQASPDRVPAPSPSHESKSKKKRRDLQSAPISPVPGVLIRAEVETQAKVTSPSPVQSRETTNAANSQQQFDFSSAD